MVTGNGDGVELRHILGSVGEDVADDSHTELRRVDVGVTYHKLLEDVVLDSTGHLLELHSLLQTCHDVEGHDRENGSVHSHGYGHLSKRNLVEEDLHVLYGADAHASLSDIADNSWVISVVSSVGREVERYGKTLLAGGQVPSVERVGLFCGGEACVLAYGPRLLDIHRAVRSSQERSHTCSIMQMLHSFQVFCSVVGLHCYLLRGIPKNFLLCCTLLCCRFCS